MSIQSLNNSCYNRNVIYVLLWRRIKAMPPRTVSIIEGETMALEITRKGMLLVLSGPAGAGKGTLAKALLEFDKTFYFSISATTRKCRHTETPDVDYHFISEKEFERLEAEGQFLETAIVHGNRYGTLKQPIIEKIEKGINVLLDIDSQGARNVIQAYPDSVSVFILPPSFAILEERLHTRNTEDPAEIAKRMANGRKEVQTLRLYDYVIINDTREQAFANLLDIIRAERQRTNRFLPRLTD